MNLEEHQGRNENLNENSDRKMLEDQPQEEPPAENDRPNQMDSLDPNQP